MAVAWSSHWTLNKTLKNCTLRSQHRYQSNLNYLFRLLKSRFCHCSLKSVNSQSFFLKKDKWNLHLGRNDTALQLAEILPQEQRNQELPSTSRNVALCLHSSLSLCTDVIQNNLPTFYYNYKNTVNKLSHAFWRGRTYFSVFSTGYGYYIGFGCILSHLLNLLLLFFGKQ